MLEGRIDPTYPDSVSEYLSLVVGSWVAGTNDCLCSSKHGVSADQIGILAVRHLSMQLRTYKFPPPNSRAYMSVLAAALTNRVVGGPWEDRRLLSVIPIESYALGFPSQSITRKFCSGIELSLVHSQYVG